MDCGIDIVQIERVTRLMQDPDVMERMFHPREMCDDAESLAGIIAAKEAYFKAQGRKGDWRSIEVVKDNAGKPSIRGSDCTLSISHDGGYAIAMVVIP